jgi:hypothetical protein
VLVVCWGGGNFLKEEKFLSGVRDKNCKNLKDVPDVKEQPLLFTVESHVFCHWGEKWQKKYHTEFVILNFESFLR